MVVWRLRVAEKRIDRIDGALRRSKFCNRRTNGNDVIQRVSIDGCGRGTLQSAELTYKPGPRVDLSTCEGNKVTNRIGRIRGNGVELVGWRCRCVVDARNVGSVDVVFGASRWHKRIRHRSACIHGPEIKLRRSGCARC